MIPTPSNSAVDKIKPMLNGSALAAAGISWPCAYPWKSAKSPTTAMLKLGVNRVLVATNRTQSQNRNRNGEFDSRHICSGHSQNSAQQHRTDEAQRNQP